MKNNFFSLIHLSLVFSLLVNMSLFAQSDGLDNFDKHKIRVKFKKQNRSALKIQRNSAMRSAKPKSCGINSVDSLNEKHHLKLMDQAVPALRPSLQAKHEKHGIDLWYEIEIDDEVTLELIEEYNKNEAIEIAEPIYKTELYFEPNDPSLDTQWSISNGALNKNIQADLAWDIETGSNNVIVAVIDSGIKYTHEDLADAMWVNEAEANGVDGVDDDGNGVIDDIHGITFSDGGEFAPLDPGPHGTAIAGIIGGVTNNGVGIAGIAGGNGTEQGVRLMSCQSFQSDNSQFGTEDRAFIYAADNGAVIVNVSWGYLTAYNFLEDAVNYFIETAGTDDNGNQIGPMKGGVVVAASGNYDSSVRTYPAAFENVIAVSSTNAYDEKAGTSTYGTWIDISAPGENIYTTGSATNSLYNSSSGTSFAAPHVVGVAALLVSKYQDQGITPDQVKEALLNSADDIDFFNEDYIGLLGSGRLNAFKALNYGLGFNCEAVTDLYEIIEAENFCEQSGIQTNSDNTYVGWIQNGDWVNYTIDFDTERVNKISASVSSANNGGTIEIRQGSPTGTLVGSIPVENTGTWDTFEQKTVDITELTGHQNLYFVFTGANGFLLNIDWIKFEELECESLDALTVIEAEDFCLESRISLTELNNETVVGPLNSDSWVNYTIDFGTGVDAIELNFILTQVGGDVEFRLDSPTGDVIGFATLVGDAETELITEIIDIDQIAGTHDIYIIYQPIRALLGAMYLDSFTFSSSVETPSTEAFIPDPDKTYYIDSARFPNTRLAATGEDELPYITSSTTTGNDVEWQFVDKGNGSWHIQRAAGGSLPRLRTDNTITDGTAVDMQGTNWSGVYTYFDFEAGAVEGSYFITLPDGPADYVRLQVDNSDNINMVGITSNGSWESFVFTEVAVSNIVTPIKLEAEDYAAMNGIQTQTTTDFDGGENVGWVNNGDWLLFEGVNLSGITNIDARVASNFTGGTIEVRTGSATGTLIGSIPVSNTGGNQNWITENSSILNTSTTEDVYLVFSGANGYLFNINWVEFNNNSTSNKNVTVSAEILNDITIYPNPVTSITTIQGAANSTISIYNINGQELLKQELLTESETLDLSSLSTGIYYAQVKGSESVSVVKIIKE